MMNIQMNSQKGYALLSGSGGDGRPVVLQRWLTSVLRWLELARQRRMLASMSHFALKDLGLSRADALHETEKPFWNDSVERD